METHLCESQSAEADNYPCNGKDAEAKKERENEKSIQQSHKSLAPLQHEDRANQKANCSIVDEDDLCDAKLQWLHEFFEAKIEEDNGGNGQTKGTTAQEQGCQSADVVTNQDNQKSNHHEDRGEGKMCSGKCVEDLLRIVRKGEWR